MGNALDDARRMYAQFTQGAGNAVNQLSSGFQNAIGQANSYVQKQLTPPNPQPHLQVFQQANDFANNIMNFVQKNPLPAAYANQQFQQHVAQPIASSVAPYAQQYAQGAGQAFQQGIPSAIRLSPPGQLAQYTQGVPNPQRQIQDVGNAFKAIGYGAQPLQTAMGGVIGSALQPKNSVQGFRQGADFSATLAPIGAAVNALTPVNQIGEKLTQNLTNPLAERFAAPAIRSALKGGAEGAIYGGLTGENPLKTAGQFALQSGALGGTLGERKMGVKEQPSMASTDMKDALDAIQNHDQILKSSDINEFMGSKLDTAEKTIRQLAQDYLGKGIAKAPIEDVKNALFDRIQYDSGMYKKAGMMGIQQTKEPVPWETPEYQKDHPEVAQTQKQVDDLAAIAQARKNSEAPVAPRPIPESKPLPIQQVAKNAITDAFSTRQTIEQNQKLATQIISAGVHGEEETRLFRDAIEHPDRVSTNAEQVQNPTGFQKAVQAFKQFTDNLYTEYNKSSTDKLGYLKDYYMHILDLSKEGESERLQQFLQQKMTTSKAFFTKNRYFADIDELQQAGFQLKNASVAEDVAQYAGTMASKSAPNAFVASVNRTNPGQAVIINDAGGMPIDEKGRSFIQLPGMRNVAVSPDLYKETRNAFGENQLGQNVGMQIANKLNMMDKTIKLALGGFHGLKTTIRALAMEPTSIPGAVMDMVNPQSRIDTLQKAVNDGVIDAAGKMGVTIDAGDLTNPNETLAQKVLSKNPVSQANNALFGGLIRRYKLDLVRQTMSRFDLNDPAQLQEARSVGSQINNLMGGLNYQVLNRNKSFQMFVKFLGLAPDFNEGKLRTLISSVTDTGAGGAFARKAIIGEAVAVGLLTEIGRRVTTGKFDTNIKDLIQNAVLDPNIPLPGQFTNPQTGKEQTAHLPGSTFADIGRAIQDPNAFVGARGAALPALTNQIRTNKDFYGQTINQPGTPLPQAIWNQAKTQLPIPVVQGIKVAQKKESLPSALLNTLGLRVGNSPTDPQQIQQQAFYKAQTEVTKGFSDNQNDKWNTLHPKKKDIDGNVIFTPGVADTEEKAIIYLNNPKMQQAEVQIAHRTPGPHDPLWDLSPTQRNMVLAARANLPNQTNAFKQALPKTSWYAPFLQQENQFFTNLGTQQQAQDTRITQAGGTLQPIPAQTAGGMPKPLPSARAQALMNQRNFTDPEVRAYLNANTQYNNNKLTEMGLPAIPSSSGGGGSSYAQRQLKLMKSKSLHAGVKNYGYKNKGIRSMKIAKMKSVSIHIPTRKSLAQKKLTKHGKLLG